MTSHSLASLESDDRGSREKKVEMPVFVTGSIFVK